NPGKLDVLVNRASANVDDDSRAAIAQLGELLGDESPHADALQSNGVQHAGGRLDNPGCRVTFALGEEEAFHRDAAKRCQVDDIGVLDPVAEAAARGDEGVAKSEIADLN